MIGIGGVRRRAKGRCHGNWGVWMGGVRRRAKPRCKGRGWGFRRERRQGRAHGGIASGESRGRRHWRAPPWVGEVRGQPAGG